jgi:hypothetical protein
MIEADLKLGCRIARSRCRLACSTRSTTFAVSKTRQSSSGRRWRADEASQRQAPGGSAQPRPTSLSKATGPQVGKGGAKSPATRPSRPPGTGTSTGTSMRMRRL